MARLLEREEADLVLRGGTVVDGTGQPAFVGDVAVTGDRIVAVGQKLPFKGKEELDASGKLVTPGWVDIHTHFDGQVMWDPYLTPSTANGVTTCVFGNCGIGFAPVQRGKEGFLINLIEALEDIPGSALHEGLKWDWETFEDYVAALKSKELACDVGVMIGHSAVRAWVMGERANMSDRPGGQAKYPVSREDVAKMASVVRDAVAVGAMGFSTSRAIYHRDGNGVLTPGSTASSEEVLAIGKAVKEAGGGIFQVTTDFATYDDVSYEKMDLKERQRHEAEEWAMYKNIIEEGGGKVKVSLGGLSLGGRFTEEFMWGDSGPLRMVGDMDHEKPGSIRMQQFVRPQWFLMSWLSRVNPFMFSARLQKLRRACREDDAELLRSLRLPENRAKIIEESRAVARDIAAATKAGRPHPAAGAFYTMFSPARLIFPWQASYEPDAEGSVAHLAQREKRHALEVMYDLMTPADGGAAIIMKPLHSYFGKPLDAMRELFLHPMCLAGGDDAGAHVGIFTDASNPTHLLAHWVRDRSSGPKIALEQAVRKHTAEPALHFNLTDRGLLQPGMKADLNVISLEKLRLHQPVWVKDLPTGAGRWVQSVEGYDLTLLSGRKTYEAGRATGLLPGRFVGNPLADSAAWRGESLKAAAQGGKEGQEDLDLRAYALQKAQGGGASAIARLARDIEAAPRSRL